MSLFIFLSCLETMPAQLNIPHKYFSTRLHDTTVPNCMIYGTRLHDTQVFLFALWQEYSSSSSAVLGPSHSSTWHGVKRLTQFRQSLSASDGDD
ncbi:hypothetical protein J6590_042046 [Homalodisca vitripennis]|nr:hypothetical protein J6590_042046 [Homalodisca vitripennis]